MLDKEKSEIRKKVRELKKQFPLSVKIERSKFIFDKLEQLDVFQKAKTVMLYWSMNDEVFTHDFVQKHYLQKEIILPSVNGDELELKKFEGVEKMMAGESFGIGEPVGEIYSNPENIDLIIVPGVAFDKNNNRLGRGKAYYDKLLKTSGAVKVGVCFDFQLFDNVPVDEHDIKMDFVILDSDE